MVVYANGVVEYEGRYYVATFGTVRSSIDPAAAKALLDRALRGGFFEWKPIYMASCSDQPEQYVAIRTRDELRVVYHYGGSTSEGACTGAPTAVLELERAIDEVAGTAKWVKCDDDPADEYAHCRKMKPITPPATPIREECFPPSYFDAEKNLRPREECF